MPEVSCNLSDCFLCSSCIPEWKAAIAITKKTLYFKKGKQVFQEGEPVKGIFFVYSGSVKIYKQWGKNKELILRLAKSGNVFGHRGLGGDELYPISATALEDVKACFITNEFLEASLKTNPGFTYKLLQFYASELQNAEKRMRNLAHMEVRGRIADALLQIGDVYGYDKNRFIATSLSRQDISSYAGTTYETVFKFFKELARRKIISTSGKNIRINKPDQLQKFISDRF
ncbi:MAG TPA: Crp/Fnr family transcriptional regulator [Chitinophagaceae bacterium]